MGIQGRNYALCMLIFRFKTQTPKILINSAQGLHILAY